MKKYTKILLILFVFSWKLVLACMPLGEETVMLGKYLGKWDATMLEIHGIQSVYSENKYLEFGFFNRFQKYTFSTDSVVNRDNIDISSLKNEI
jgi:hypothetical protein